ncbi:hypothetical protein KGY73_07170 [bacterium]|nr:hypothetical protein [bacterium]
MLPKSIGIIFLFQQSPSPPDGGLPFWIFWLLTSFIFLLLVFIFLRDKQLRQRINSFFFRLRKQLIAFHLRHKHKKELREKNTLFKEIGQTAWMKGISMKENPGITQQLSYLDKKSQTHHQQLKGAHSELDSLQRELKKARQEIQSLKEEKPELKKKNKNSFPDSSHIYKRIQQHLRTKKARVQNIKKEIQKLEKTKKKINQDINHIENQKENLFQNLGQLVKEKRIDYNALSHYYIQVDEHNHRIQKLENHMRNIK